MCDESGLRGGSGRVAALSGEMRRNPAFGGNIILHNIYYRRNAWQKIAQNQELGKYFSVTWACPPLLQPVKYKKPLDPAPTSRTPSTPPPPANSPAAALIQPATSRISGAPLQAASHAVMHAQTGLPIDTAIWLAAQESPSARSHTAPASKRGHNENEGSGALKRANWREDQHAREISCPDRRPDAATVVGRIVGHVALGGS